MKFSVQSETRFSGYWPGEPKEVLAKSNSSFEGELLPGGRFIASFKPYSIPWTQGQGKLFSKDMEASFDGVKATTLTLARGPFGEMSPAKSAAVDAGLGLLDTQLEQMLALQAFVGLSQFRGLSGAWKDLTNWGSVPIDLLNIEYDETSSSIKLSLVDKNPHLKTKEYSETLEISLKPKIGVKHYLNINRNSKGEVESSYEVSVSEFDLSSNSPLMFPKKAKSVLKNRDVNGTGWNERESNFSYEYSAVTKNSPQDFNVHLPNGTFVRDSRLGIEFEMSENPNTIIQTLQKIK